MNFKSYGFWTALAGAVVMLVESLGQMFGFSIDNEVVSSVIMAIAGVLVVLGVVSMPSKEKQPDDESGEQEADEENEGDKN